MHTYAETFRQKHKQWMTALFWEIGFVRGCYWFCICVYVVYGHVCGGSTWVWGCARVCRLEVDPGCPQSLSLTEPESLIWWVLIASLCLRCHVSTSWMLGYRLQAGCHACLALLWMLGFEFLSSHLCNKHFLLWVVSPTANINMLLTIGILWQGHVMLYNYH